MKMRLAATIAMLVAFTGTVTDAALAQSGCGQADSALVMHWLKYFRGDEFEAIRDSVGIVEISAMAPREVVTDRIKCDEIVSAGLQVLQSEPIWKTIEQEGWRYTILRYGPYYAMSVDIGPIISSFPLQPGQTVTLWHGYLLIFERGDSGLIYVGGIVQ